MNHKQIEQYILGFDGTWLDYPFGPETSVYKYGDKSEDAGKMFALIDDKSDPLRISLKCDPVLALTLRDKYETVLPGYHLNKKHWNTIILTGQLGQEELYDLIRHSYELVRG